MVLHFLLRCLVIPFLFSLTLVSPLFSDTDAHDAPQTLTIWGDTIVTFQMPYRSHSVSDRIEEATKKIKAIPVGQKRYEVKAVPSTLGDVKGVWIAVNDRNIFGIMEEDFEPEEGKNFEQYTQEVAENLRRWIEKRERQQSLPLLLKGIGFSAAATLLFALLLKTLLHYSRKVSKKLEQESGDRTHPLILAGINLRPYLTSIGIGLLKITVWGIGLPLVYIWVTFVFHQFPVTSSMSKELTLFVIDLLSVFYRGAVDAVPGLIAVIIIFFITRLISRASGAFFLSIEEEKLHVSWMEPETARASRRVATVLIWIFALVVAYPYIPGSETEAFKGITVLIGLMVSLGSAGIVGQILGGIVVVYTRAFQTGDYVKIDTHEGSILEIGVLSTKIKTLRNEEVTIPNAVLLSATTTNFSRYARKAGENALVSTTVTIGYDTPWRQVHAMLEMAAERTETILTTPPPRILQKALSDFYVEYTLIIAIEHAEERYIILSQLHANIQDVFNEYGVQIMSPNFKAQPEKAVLVPKEQWYASPAAAPDKS